MWEFLEAVFIFIGIIAVAGLAFVGLLFVAAVYGGSSE